MHIPWIVYAGSAAQVLPLVTGAVRRRRLSTARKWVLGWCAFLVSVDFVVLMFSFQHRNNHWLNYIAAPISGGIVLWALSYWQMSPLAALWLRLMVPLLGLAWAGMVLAIEDTHTFSLLAEPFAGLLLLGSAIGTLIVRASREPGPLAQQDWLWVGAGMALYSGVAVGLPPAANLLLTKSPDLVNRAYEVKAALNVVAFVLIARGMLCPAPAGPSGGLSSRGFPHGPVSSPVSSRPG